MKTFVQNFEVTPAVISLIGMNLIPLIGVFLFGWDVGTIIFLYWLENVIIGLLNIPKIWACQGYVPHLVFLGNIAPEVPSAEPKINPSTKEPIVAIAFLTVFFSLHYGLFCVGHYVFLKSTYPALPSFGEMFGTLTGPILFWSLLGLTLSHLVSMVVNFYGKREFLKRTPSKQMFVPYYRIVLLHMVIIFSGFVALATGQSLATLLLLVGLKIGFDLAAHVAEHQKVQSLNASVSD